jgi:hypothetical protein
MGGKFLFFTLNFLILTCLSEIKVSGAFPAAYGSDTVDIQRLYNGRAWRNLYYKVKGDQFLFTTEFLPGSVTVEGKEYDNLRIKYDIYNDELLLITNHGIILQMNKEMVDQFSLEYNQQIHCFKKIETDSPGSLSGYINVMYDGNTSLYVKYKKEILLLAVENKYDIFNQINRIYLEKDGKMIQVNSKREFMNLLGDHKQQVHSFIKSNKIKVTRKNPESFKPVVEYYDKLGQ